MDQLLVDQDDVYTRIFSHRVLTTPLLESPVITENRKSLTTCVSRVLGP